MKVHNLLLRAIKEKRLIRFVYQDKKRIAEPHDYGVQKGSVRLLSYQIGGESSSGKLPDWRWLEVPQMKNVELLEEKFAGNREAPSGQHHKWDEVYARVSAPQA
jgi:WYL domain